MVSFGDILLGIILGLVFVFVIFVIPSILIILVVKLIQAIVSKNTLKKKTEPEKHKILHKVHSTDIKKYQTLSVIAFVSGILSMLFSDLYIFGFTTLILSIVALILFKENKYAGKWMLITALVLGIIYGFFYPIVAIGVKLGL